MSSLQGEFANKAAAQKAIAALTSAGVPRNHIRLWNIIPDHKSESSDGGAVGGAIIGGLLGGALGVATGAAAGATIEGAYGAESHLPAPAGVRLVVDIDGAGVDTDRIVSMLREAGSTNVHHMAG